jgi:hypothetical protein
MKDRKMTRLSPKAIRFIGRAVTLSKHDRIRKVWSTLDGRNGGELPDRIARAALTALRESRKGVNARLASPLLTEDDAVELSNDLGFIRAIEADLEAQIARDSEIPPTR